MTTQAKDLKVGTEYWLDNDRDVSGVCIEVDVERDVVKFKEVPDQPKRYVVSTEGYVTFPVNVPYEYKEVEA